MKKYLLLSLLILVPIASMHGMDKSSSSVPQLVGRRHTARPSSNNKKRKAKKKIPIEERIKSLYALGDIKDINILRKKLKQHENDQEAWDAVNTLGAGPTPFMRARANGYNGCSALLFNYNRSDDPFFQALMFGDKSKLDDILKKNPKKINEPSFLDILPISWAIMLEDKELVSYLLKKGAKIDIRSRLGMRPFDETYSLPAIRQLMMRYGGSRLKRQQDFFKVIHEDDVEKMEDILERNKQSKPNINIIKQPLFNRTPLEAAVLGGNVKAARYLITKGALSIPEEDSYRRKLFLSACTFNKIPMMRLLVDKDKYKIGFYLSERNNKYCPFNFWLSEEVQHELFALYKEYNRTTNQELLSLATKLGYRDLIQQALDAGANINKYDKDRMNALLWACSYGNPDAIAFLIQKDANLDLGDKKGRCGLRKLIRMHKTSPQKDGRQLTTSELLPCLLLLVCHGADQYIKDKCGESPIDWIKKQTFNEVERKLIDRVLGANWLGRTDLRYLLDDIYAFQLEELKQVQAANDKQAIFYIERSLVKLEMRLSIENGSKAFFKGMYEDYL